MVHNGGTRESSDQVALLRPSKCPTARTDQYPTRAITSSKWDLRTALVSSVLQTVDIVWVKLDSLCRGELNHSNVPYSREPVLNYHGHDHQIKSCMCPRPTK